MSLSSSTAALVCAVALVLGLLLGNQSSQANPTPFTFASSHAKTLSGFADVGDWTWHNLYEVPAGWEFVLREIWTDERAAGNHPGGHTVEEGVLRVFDSNTGDTVYLKKGMDIEWFHDSGLVLTEGQVVQAMVSRFTFRPYSHRARIFWSGILQQ